MSSQLSWSIIKQFSSRNMFGFTFQDVVREFPQKHLQVFPEFCDLIKIHEVL